MARPDTGDSPRRAVSLNPAGDRIITKNTAAERALGITITDTADSRAPRLAEVLDLSGERDRWERLALDWARSAYRSGHQDGLRAGRVDGFRMGYADASAAWWLAAGPAPRTGSHAELDRLRFPPAGREHFADPRPGDYRGRQHD